ncbi:MAG: DUF3558 domain-containing protein [Gemmatimonadetes bacterium]|nr:DUF3558 domain-containing protein [Gemmatimonadota bacterium]
MHTALQPLTHRAPRAATLGGLLLMTACGGRDRPPPPEAEPATAAVARPAPPPLAPLDPCALLSGEEVTAVVGKAVTGPARSQSGKACEFTVAGRGVVNFMTETVASPAGATELMEAMKASGARIAEAPGIGERSFWAPQTGMIQLNTYQGGHHIILTLALLGADSVQQTIAAQLMQKVLSKL